MGRKTKSHSPVITKKENIIIDFPSAIKEVMKGNKLTKLEWGDSTIIMLLENNYLSIKYGDKPSTPLIVSDGDLYGEDWVVISETTVN